MLPLGSCPNSKIPLLLRQKTAVSRDGLLGHGRLVCEDETRAFSSGRLWCQSPEGRVASLAACARFATGCPDSAKCEREGGGDQLEEKIGEPRHTSQFFSSGTGGRVDRCASPDVQQGQCFSCASMNRRPKVCSCVDYIYRTKQQRFLAGSGGCTDLCSPVAFARRDYACSCQFARLDARRPPTTSRGMCRRRPFLPGGAAADR